MKNYIIPFYSLVLFLFSVHCSKEGDPSPPAPTPDPDPVVVLHPSTPSLSFPNNNAPCLDSTVVNDSQSSVTFRWSTSENTTVYELVLVSLINNTTQRFTSAANELTVTLIHAEPYSWKVTARGESGSTPAESSTWKFFLAGPAQEDYAPFPPELTTPISGSTITPIDGMIELQWNCSDIDQDLATYQVYLDQSDATTLVRTIDFQSNTTAVDVEVENNSVYYWRVVAIDAAGNESQSGIYAFRTN